MENTLFEALENRKLYYGDKVKSLIGMMARLGQKTDIENNIFFGKYIHAFAWAFFTGVYENKKEFPDEWKHKNGFDFGIYMRDGSTIVAQTMFLIGISECNLAVFDDNVMNQNFQRKLLNEISSYAEGGASHILEIRQGEEINSSTYLDNISDFYNELEERIDIHSDNI